MDKQESKLQLTCASVGPDPRPRRPVVPGQVVQMHEAQLVGPILLEPDAGEPVGEGDANNAKRALAERGHIHGAARGVGSLVAGPRDPAVVLRRPVAGGHPHGIAEARLRLLEAGAPGRAALAMAALYEAAAE